MFPYRRIIQLGLVAFLAFVAGADGSRAAVPASGVLDFAIVRNGKEIGRQVYTFTALPGGLEVDVRTRIDFKLGFISLHRFKHDSHELWQGTRLVAMSSSTSEKNIVKGRSRHEVNVEVEGGGLNIRANRRAWQAPSSALPASLWNERLIETKTLIDTVDGEELSISVEPLGDDVILVNGRRLDTRYYRVSGDLERELWYDRDNVLVRVRFTADDGSEVQYVLR
jgi:hypothetical protein